MAHASKIRAAKMKKQSHPRQYTHRNCDAIPTFLHEENVLEDCVGNAETDEDVVCYYLLCLLKF